MGIIEKIVVADETLQRLERDARQNGRTVAAFHAGDPDLREP